MYVSVFSIRYILYSFFFSQIASNIRKSYEFTDQGNSMHWITERLRSSRGYNFNPVVFKPYGAVGGGKSSYA